MWPYWFLFLIPAFQATIKLRQPRENFQLDRWPNTWRLVFILLVSMIGMRHEVGGDWTTYIRQLNDATGTSIEEMFSDGEPAYSLLNWIAAQSGLGVYLVNSIFALLFTWGLLSFCRVQPRPWLALVVAVPYLITVVAMGYSRQGVAIGLALLGLVALQNKNTWKFMLWVGLAATFHKSAIILMPLAVLAGSKRPIFTLFLVVVTSALLFGLLLQEYVDFLVAGY